MNLTRFCVIFHFDPNEDATFAIDLGLFDDAPTNRFARLGDEILTLSVARAFGKKHKRALAIPAEEGAEEGVHHPLGSRRRLHVKRRCVLR